jgi:hypothetical protein
MRAPTRRRWFQVVALLGVTMQVPGVIGDDAGVSEDAPPMAWPSVRT